MTHNPILNALAAALYILLVAFLLSFIDLLPEPTNAFGPIAGFLSLFVLSAAVTGYAIIGMPLRLFLEGKKKEAVTLFIQTLLAFAAVSALLCVATFFIPPGLFQALQMHLFGVQL